MKFPKVFRWNGSRRVLEQRARRSGLGKSNYIPQGRCSSEHHRNAVEAKRDTAVRRCARFERIEQETESMLCLFFADTQQTEHPSLHGRVVDADAATAELGAVEHHVVSKRTNFFRRCVEQSQVFRIRRCERVMHGAQRAVPFPYEQWKISHPQE